MHPEALRKKVRQHAADTGARWALATAQEQEEIPHMRAVTLAVKGGRKLRAGAWRRAASEHALELRTDEHSRYPRSTDCAQPIT